MCVHVGSPGPRDMYLELSPSVSHCCHSDSWRPWGPHKALLGTFATPEATLPTPTSLPSLSPAVPGDRQSRCLLSLVMPSLPKQLFQAWVAPPPDRAPVVPQGGGERDIETCPNPFLSLPGS
jgi:hypothetical protein